MESFGQVWMCLSLWPGGQDGLYPIFLGLPGDSRCSRPPLLLLSLSALNLVAASYELAASSRLRATDFCHNVGVVLLHPGNGGHRLEALSMSEPSNSVAASPEIMGVTSSMSSVSTSCPSSPTRVAFFLPLGGAALPENLSTNCQREHVTTRVLVESRADVSTLQSRATNSVQHNVALAVVFLIPRVQDAPLDIGAMACANGELPTRPVGMPEKVKVSSCTGSVAKGNSRVGMPSMRYFGNSRWRSNATRNSPSVKMMTAEVTSKCKPRRSWTDSSAQPMATVPARTSFALSTAFKNFLNLVFATKSSVETLSVPSRLTM